MKPRFEEHDGKLFRMLDKPVQLKEKNTNVLVRFITHGIIGEYVMEHWLDCNQKNVPIFVKDVDSDGDVTVCIENGNEHICCPFPMFEIIGTPVAEGSAEWALYQMMQGKKVTKRHLSHIYWQYDARPHLKCISEYNCGTLQIMVSPEIWLKTAEPTGWQIYKEPEIDKEPIADCDNCKHICTNNNIDHCQMYEPKPELKYRAGDFVEIINCYSDTKFSGRIDSIDDHEIHIGTLRFDISGKSVMERLPQFKITHKLKPSEVIVNIGCLSGTIEDLSYAEDGRFWFIGGKTEMCPGGMYCILYLEMLDTQTLEIVESLLKAQEEEK